MLSRTGCFRLVPDQAPFRACLRIQLSWSQVVSKRTVVSCCLIREPWLPHHPTSARMQNKYQQDIAQHFTTKICNTKVGYPGRAAKGRVDQALQTSAASPQRELLHDGQIECSVHESSDYWSVWHLLKNPIVQGLVGMRTLMASSSCSVKPTLQKEL